MSTEPTEAPARDEVESTVHRLLAEILYVEPDEVDLDTGFIELGLDSILAVEYVAQLRSELGVSETIEELHDLGTPRALVNHILAGSPAA